MKESYGEGQAGHTGPESCAGGCEAAGEALTGVRAGWVSSLETPNSGVPTPCMVAEGNTPGLAARRRPGDPAGSKTPRTLGNSMHRNWETPRLTPWPLHGARVMNPPRARWR